MTFYLKLEGYPDWVHKLVDRSAQVTYRNCDAKGTCEATELGIVAALDEVAKAAASKALGGELYPTSPPQDALLKAREADAGLYEAVRHRQRDEARRAFELVPRVDIATKDALKAARVAHDRAVALSRDARKMLGYAILTELRQADLDAAKVKRGRR